MWNYLIGFRANLEAALITDKRPRPRSDIEDAMFVVNDDVRRPRRYKQCERVTETAGRGMEDRCQRLKLLYRDVLHTARHVQTYLASIYATDVCFISQITTMRVLMERNSAHPEEYAFAFGVW